MGTTIDHDHWLDSADLEDEDEKQNLIDSIMNVRTVGTFETVWNPRGQLLVSGPGCLDHLLLRNEKARDRFVRMVTKVEVPDDLELGFLRSCAASNT